VDATYAYEHEDDGDGDNDDGCDGYDAGVGSDDYYDDVLRRNDDPHRDDHLYQEVVKNFV